MMKIVIMLVMMTLTITYGVFIFSTEKVVDDDENDDVNDETTTAILWMMMYIFK